MDNASFSALMRDKFVSKGMPTVCLMRVQMLCLFWQRNLDGKSLCLSSRHNIQMQLEAGVPGGYGWTERRMMHACYNHFAIGRWVLMSGNCMHAQGG